MSHVYLIHLDLEVRFEIKGNLFETDTGLVGQDRYTHALRRAHDYLK